MRYVFVYIYYSSTSTYKIGGTMNQKNPYFYHVNIFSCCFHNSADCFVYIFALLLLFMCNYLHVQKQLYLVIFIKHLGEIAIAATISRFFFPAIPCLYINNIALFWHPVAYLHYPISVYLFFSLQFSGQLCSTPPGTVWDQTVSTAQHLLFTFVFLLQGCRQVWSYSNQHKMIGLEPFKMDL